MNIKPYIEYSFNLSGSFQFGLIPQGVLTSVFGNGRQSGVLLEYDVAERFSNLTKEGCGQGSGEDLRMIVGSQHLKIQCKTVRLDKKGDVGWTTKSGLWDSKRGKKVPASEWDEKHNSYFPNYDYFMYLDISRFAPSYSVLLVPTSDLFQCPEIETQQQEYHFGKRGRSATYCEPPNNWVYPIKVTSSMYNRWRKN